MGKRGKGEGSVRKRKDGSWEVRVSIGYDPSTGKPKRISKYFKTRTEAKDWLTQTLHQQQTGTFIEPHKTTVGEWLDIWLDLYAKPKVRISTWESYETTVRKHIKPTLGNILLKELMPQHLQQLYNQKLHDGRVDGKGGLSSTTVRYIHTVMHQALDQAVKEQLVYRNLADAVNKPKAKRHEIMPLTADQINLFLSIAKGHRFFPAFMLEWGSGLRRGELLGLNWKDVDLHKGTISIRRSLIRTRKGLIMSDPKTEKSRRTIPIPEEVVTELKVHKAHQAGERLFFGSAYHNNDLVFCSEDGRPIDPRNFTRRFEGLLKKAGLPKVSFHNMRHSHATMLLSLGEHPKVVQERLGHSTIAMTMDTYSHVVPGLQEKLAEKLSTVLDLEKSTHAKANE